MLPLLMYRTLLLVVLILGVVIDAVLTLGLLFARSATLQQFGGQLTPDTSFLAFVLAWVLLFVTLVCALAAWQVWQRDARYPVLCYLLGFWWVAIGIAIYVGFGKPDNLLLDSLKGALIVLFTRLSNSREPTGSGTVGR